MKLPSPKTLLRLAPAFFLFGPLLIAIAIEGPLRSWAVLGALMAGFGCLIVHVDVLRQSLLIGELERRLAEKSGSAAR